MVVDASVWVSSLVRQDLHHQASREWIRQQLSSGTSFAIPTLALAEIAGAVARRRSSPALGHLAIESVTRTVGLRLISCDRSVGEEAARIAADYRLRGADATYAAVARLLGLPLYTWDQELLQRAAPLVLVRTP